MSINIIYRPLFNVKLWHGYYLHSASSPNNLENALEIGQQQEITENSALLKNYNISNDLKTIPTEATKKLMAGYNMIFRPNRTGFSVETRAKKNENGRYSPFIAFSEQLHLTFLLQVQRHSFINFTDHPLDELGKRIFHFSNRANNTLDSLLYLNKRENYAETQDRVHIKSSRFSIDVRDLNTHDITFVLESEITPDRQEIICSEIEPGINLEFCQLNWDALPSGVYRFSAFDEGRKLDFNPFPQGIYINTGDIPGNIFGIIEILYLPDVHLGEYDLVQGIELQENVIQVLRSPIYTLWWKNRLTRWLYIFESDQSIAPDPRCDVDNPSGSIPYKRLHTKNQYPLISAYQRISFYQEDGSEEVMLPNPDADNIYPNPDSDEVYSEIYLGNLNLNRM